MAKSERVIGRLAEKRVLDSVVASKDPELVAVYGRRRLGKTYLIREYLKSHLVLEFSGIHDQSTAMQLANFHMSLRQAFPAIPLVHPRNWLEAFELLRHALAQPALVKGKRVVFIDEFPWLATRKSGFVTETVALDKKSKGSLLRLTDEFSVFYWRWMQSAPASSSWLRQSSSRRYEAWCGYAFESLCIKHLDAIRAAIGISDVETQAVAWRHVPQAGSDEEGAQIDLLLDRADRCLNICEIKFSDKPYVVSKSYASTLERKLRVFGTRSNRHQTLFLTMVTPAGIVPNRYTQKLVTNQVVLSDLFAAKRLRG